MTWLWMAIRFAPVLMNKRARCYSVAPSFSKTKHGSIDAHLRRLSKTGQLKEAAFVLDHLSRHEVHASEETYARLLQECINQKAWSEGKQIHASMKANRILPDVFTGNILINMYIKSGKMADARDVFEKLLERNDPTWALMIIGSIRHGDHMEAFSMFGQMDVKEPKSSKAITLLILKSCKTLEQGKLVHMFIVSSVFESDNFLGSALIDMYAGYGYLDDSWQVFLKVLNRDVVTWNSMISGYAQEGYGTEALAVISQFREEGMEADEVTFSSALKACTSIEDLKQGKFVHCYVRESNIEINVVIENALIDMYAKCGGFDTARMIFYKMSQRDVISWTAMLVGCAQHEHYEEACSLFGEMQNHVRLDEVAFVSLLHACANLSALEFGQKVHAHILNEGFKIRARLYNTLIDMYAKCGSMEYACQIFKHMPDRDSISWTTIISGYALHGSVTEVFELADRMLHDGMKLDHVTFVGVLNACSHAGLVGEGFYFFYSMIKDHGITPVVEHYACMVDLLTRAGRLKEAMVFIEKSKCQPNIEIWTAVLSACKSMGEVKLAERAAICLLKLEPESTAAFVLLGNIYAEWGDRSEKMG